MMTRTIIVVKMVELVSAAVTVLLLMMESEIRLRISVHRLADDIKTTLFMKILMDVVMKPSLDVRLCEPFY